MSIAERARALAKEQPRSPLEIAEIIYAGKPTAAQIRYIYAVLNGHGPGHWSRYQKSQ